MRYRPEIDGLRAVAVGAVFAYHLDPHLAPGGFVGVDVFFVISGFLITGMIAEELEAGTFRFARFYERRFRRLLPALLAMLAVVTTVGWGVLFPRQLDTLGQSAVFSVVPLANVFFWSHLGGYFSENAGYVPLLHTWSLAVEEQFYLVVPALLVALAAWRPGWRGPAIWGALVLSFAASVWGVREGLSAAFFLPQFRAWELLTGAVIGLRLVPAVRSRAMGEAAALAGVAMILAAVFLFDDGTAFPGASAALPCLGTALVIWASGGAVRPLAARVLSLRGMVGVGLISYSLYLWHWPVIVAVRHLSLEPPGVAAKLAIVAGALSVAWLSWRFVERPWRRPSASRAARTELRIASVAVAAVLLAGFGLKGATGFVAGWSPVIAEVLASAEDGSPFGACAHEAAEAPDLAASCAFGTGDRDFYVLSDSHGVPQAEGLYPHLEAAGWRLRLLPMNSCPPSSGYRDTAAKGCAEAVDRLVGEIAAEEPGVVLLAAFYFRWDAEEDRGAFWEGMARTVARLRAAGHEVVLAGAVPSFAGRALPEQLAVAELHGIAWEEYAFAVDADRAESVDRELRHLAEGDRGVSYAPLIPELCGGSERCPAVYRGAVLYFDAHHLTVSAAHPLVEAAMLPEIAPVLERAAGTRVGALD